MQVVIENLNIKIDKKKILNNFNITINNGEIHAIMGPNGVGKSTLSKVIMGYPEYNIISGNIIVNNQKINDLEINLRSKLGIFLVYQNPISIEGITNSEFIKTCVDSHTDKKRGLYEFVKELDQKIEELDMNKDMLYRSLNQGFSGGERKKNEILQMKMLKPKFIILDELDSGLDVDSLRIVCQNINDYLKDNPDTSVLIITHYTRILDYIKPSHVHMMKDGNITLSGDFKLAKMIEKYGYNQSFDIDMVNTYE